jgi:hypothetical protein
MRGYVSNRMPNNMSNTEFAAKTENLAPREFFTLFLLWLRRLRAGDQAIRVKVWR